MSIHSNVHPNIYRSQTKSAKAMFLHLSVSNSVHGEVCIGGGDCVEPRPSDTAGYGQRDAVRILLECILVTFEFVYIYL